VSKADVDWAAPDETGGQGDARKVGGIPGRGEACAFVGGPVFGSERRSRREGRTQTDQSHHRGRRPFGGDMTHAGVRQ
jgi:hypothetical protein